MAKKPDEEKDISFPNQKIVNINLEHEMENAYIEYAMSVIVGRALPDVRDGLKPVHRRILYSMYESGLTSDKPFKKSATCVGDVLGKYHPHGDASVYDAMVRLGQDFSMRYCLVEGHGNFGSIDGDPPAAYRYTEARMSKIANEMLRDIEKETVDWDPNFDESRKEPRVLPSRFPQPAGQRLQRHRRGHDHQHPAPQPAGGHQRHHLCAGQPGGHPGRPDGAHQGPRLPHPGDYHGPVRHPGGLRHRQGPHPGAGPHRDGGVRQRPHPHHRH